MRKVLRRDCFVIVFGWFDWRWVISERSVVGVKITIIRRCCSFFGKRFVRMFENTIVRFANYFVTSDAFFIDLNILRDDIREF